MPSAQVEKLKTENESLRSKLLSIEADNRTLGEQNRQLKNALRLIGKTNVTAGRSTPVWDAIKGNLERYLSKELFNAVKPGGD